MKIKRWFRLAAWVVLSAAALALAFLLPATIQAIYLVLVLAIINTVGLSMLIGYAGQLSLGQGAFYATGAYTAGILAVNHVPPILAFVAGPIVSMIIAWIIGIPLLRLSGPFLAFATLAFHLILLALITQGGDLTGGGVGLQGIPVLDFFGLSLRSQADYSVLAVIVLILVMLITRNVIDSRVGRALRGLAGNEASVAAVGINIGRVKLSTFILTAGFGGIAGSVYAFAFGYLSPASFPAFTAFQFIIMAAVGGMGTLVGPIVGASLVTVIVQFLNTWSTSAGMPASAPAILTYAVYAVMLIVIVLFLPRGIWPALVDLGQRIWRRGDVPVANVGGVGTSTGTLRQVDPDRDVAVKRSGG